MRKKRFLFFNDSMTLGGTEVLLVDLLNHLVAKDCNVTLLLPSPSSQNILINKLSPNIEIRYLYDETISHRSRKIEENLMIFFPKFFSKLKGVRASNYDEVVCFKECFYARIFSVMNIPKMLWVHNILYRRTYEVRSFKERLAVWLNKLQLKVSQKSYDNYDKVICVSDACKQAYHNVLHNGDSPRQDIRVLYNAVDLTKIIEKSKEPIEDLPQSEMKFILITRVSPEKRTDRLINASARLRDEGYNFHVYIIGEGLEAVESEYVRVKKLDNVISFLGQKENPYPYILQSNWLLCVSERESFSLALLEAMTLKTPVITTNCGGPSDIVAGGKYGILVDNSTEGVYDGMKRVLDDPSLSVDYISHLDEAVSRFDYRGWLRKVEDLLGIQSL